MWPDMSLRTQSKFSLEELEEGIRIVHERGKKIYLTLNLYIHNEEAEKLPQFVDTLKRLEPDGSDYRNFPVRRNSLYETVFRNSGDSWFRDSGGDRQECDVRLRPETSGGKRTDPEKKPSLKWRKEEFARS